MFIFALYLFGHYILLHYKYFYNIFIFSSETLFPTIAALQKLLTAMLLYAVAPP